MHAEESLEQIGSEYLARIEAEQPQFLIEIDVPDSHLEEIFNSISKARPQTRWTAGQSACLALAAVHSASRANEGEGSLRGAFYRRLGRKFDPDEWENSYGPCIADFLRDWFTVELPRSGPYRYVGSIYRHAGIPIPARSSFCLLLRHLLKNRTAFARDLYADAVQKVSPTVAKRFLESQAGYDFTQRTAQFVVRWAHGQIAAHELEDFPSYRRSLYQAVLSEMQRVPERSLTFGSYLPPRLALDPDTRSLVVMFDRSGITANVYKTTAGSVYNTKQRVSDPAPLQYVIKPEQVWQTVTPWWVPGQSSTALFRVGDGSLADMSHDVPAGSYYLVTSSPELVPPEIVREEGTYLEYDGVDATETYYSILCVDLAPGYELPELSIRTRGSAAPPALEFADAEPLRHQLGSEIFVGRLPSLRVSNWTAECTNKYWLWIDDGSGEKRLRLAPDSSDLEVSVPCPSQGTIRLEPKSYIRDSSAAQRLNFAVIPSGIQIQPHKTSYGIHEPTLLKIKLPPGWTFTPKSQLQSGRADLWQVSAEERVIDAVLSFKSLKFSISLLIPRVALWFKGQKHDGEVLWKDDLSRDLPILVEGLPNTRCSILLEADRSSLEICDLGVLPASGARNISLTHFRDALATCAFGMAKFSLQVGGQAIPTGKYFANEDIIVRTLAGESVESILFRLPNIGTDLLQARLLFDRAPATLSFSTTIGMPDSLWSFLCGLACGAAEFDSTLLDDGALERYKNLAPDHFLSVLSWVDHAKKTLRSLGNKDDVFTTFPADDVTKLPVARWRHAVSSLLENLQLNQSIPELLLKWRRAVENPDREGECDLLQRVGGRELMEAARRYVDSFLERDKARNDILTRSIIDLRRVVSKSDLDPLLRVIAFALLQLGYYRSGRFQATADIPISQVPPSFERLSSLMRALSLYAQGKPTCSLSKSGLGFAHVSTRPEDASLEVELENAGERKTNPHVVSS